MIKKYFHKKKLVKITYLTTGTLRPCLKNYYNVVAS